MKKVVVFLIIIGGILFLMPQVEIVADVTTKMLGTMLWAVAGFGVGCALLYRFQKFCDRVAHQLYEQKKRELAERNVEIVYPSVRAIGSMLAHFLPRLLGVCFVALAIYLAISFAWYLILPVLKYAAYAIGTIVLILLLCCVFTTKSDVIDEPV